MATFTDNHKEEASQGNYFDEGIHKVKIDSVEFGTTDKEKEYAEFKVLGEGGEEGSARVWFTTDGAIKYAFNTIRSIFVHNTPEKRRDEIREKVNAAKSTEDLAKLCEALRGKECWYSVAKSDRTYTTQNGELRHSYDRNVYGYEPKPRAKTNVQKVQDTTGGQEITKDNAESIFPF